MRKNFPKAIERTYYKQHAQASVVVTPETFNRVRELAIKKDCSMASMMAILIQKGLKDYDVSK